MGNYLCNVFMSKENSTTISDTKLCEEQMQYIEQTQYTEQQQRDERHNFEAAYHSQMYLHRLH